MVRRTRATLSSEMWAVPIITTVRSPRLKTTNESLHSVGRSTAILGRGVSSGDAAAAAAAARHAVERCEPRRARAASTGLRGAREAAVDVGGRTLYANAPATKVKRQSRRIEKKPKVLCHSVVKNARRVRISYFFPLEGIGHSEPF